MSPAVLLPVLAALAGGSAAAWFLGQRERDIVCQLGGLTWDRQAFCRGWFISGATGSGKTLSGLRQLLFQLFTNQPHFGGLCIDDKGTLHQTLLEMAAHFGRAQDVIVVKVKPDGAPADWQPEHRTNLIGDSNIPASTLGKCVADTASALGNRREQGFFRSATQIHIGQGIQALGLLGYEVALDNVCQLLTNPDDLKEVIDQLQSLDAGAPLADHFSKYLAQPPEQLAGITGTITNYLHHFLTPEIAEVFCRDSTFSLADMDRGKIICLALPHRFQTERRYVGTLLKQLFYLHVLRRFDLPAAERERLNLLAFVADEAQHFLTVAEDGLSDHAMVDVIREAGAAFIAAAQSTTSLTPVLGADAAKVLLLNLRNRIGFASADEDDAKLFAEFIGKKNVYEYSETHGDGKRSRTRHRKEKYLLEPHALRKLRNHEAILVHAEKGIRRRFLAPIEADGKFSPWFRRPLW